MPRFKLVTFLSSTIVCLGFGSSLSLAQSSKVEASPTTSIVRPYIAKMNMKPEQMVMLAKVMHSSHHYCYLQDLDPGDDSSMLLICQAGPLTPPTFSP